MSGWNVCMIARLDPSVVFRHTVPWRRTGNTFRTMGEDRNLRRMGDISLILVPWCCAQMATTIQVEVVGYFRMGDTLVLNNRHSS